MLSKIEREEKLIMAKKFTKNILCIILITLFLGLIPLISACADDGYELVCFVRYTTNGELKTARSAAYPNLDGTKGISDSEYQTRLSNAGQKYAMSDATFQDGTTLSKTSKTIDTYFGLTQEDVGCTLIWRQNIGGSYYDCFKATFNGWYYTYTYVKVIDNETISIHFGDKNSATTYKVTSYQLFYFE